MRTTTDIDIDVQDRDAVLKLFDHVPASHISGTKAVRHNFGVYFHEMPHDPLTGLASIDHAEATARGFFKIDILNVKVYAAVRDEDHLLRLMHTEPTWDLLQYPEFVEGQQIFQLKNHAALLREMKPRSIEQLAMILGMIRPAKQHLRGRPWGEVARDIWVKPSDPVQAKGFFKKAHGICYAHVVAMQMNLICEQMLQG
jgi:hypothetical protein